MSQPKRILLLDTGNEWGGGTNSMFELLLFRLGDFYEMFFEDARQAATILSSELWLVAP